MWGFLKTRGVDLAVAAIGLTALMAEPAWSGPPPPMPGPAVGGLLAGAAIIGALVIAKWWRRK